jgi:hypothetical protein
VHVVGLASVVWLWCYAYTEQAYWVGVEHALRTPSGAVQQSASGSSSAGFIRLDLAPHTPAEYGTWTHQGTYQQITHEWFYEWNDWTQTYDGYYLGAWP